MSDPEPNAILHQRLLRVVAEKDRRAAMVVVGAYVDALGREYDRFRADVPLKGFGPRGT